MSGDSAGSTGLAPRAVRDAANNCPGEGLSRRGLFRTGGQIGLVLAGSVAALNVPGLLFAPAAAAAVNGKIGRDEMIKRAWERYHDKPWYSQRGSLKGYRRDCSGFVSFAWKVKRSDGSSHSTATLPSISHKISRSEMKPGDIILNPGRHVRIFVKWADSSKKSFWILEHGSSYPDYRKRSTLGSGYYAARYDKVTEDKPKPPPPPPKPSGAIGNKWKAEGGNTSPIGKPTTDERDAAGKGRYQIFKKGVILWHPDTGAWMIRGAIHTAFYQGGDEHKIGYPLMDEQPGWKSPTGTTGKYQKFDKKMILWSSKTGAHIVEGAILTHFLAHGREGAYGYPTSNETKDGTIVRQTFERGTMRWESGKGTVWIPNRLVAYDG